MPARALVCMNDAGVGELIRLLLTAAGYSAAGLDLFAWLEETSPPDLDSDIIILDAWPLRHPEMATRAGVQLTRCVAALILVVDGPQTDHLTRDLGASATLSLLFTQDDLLAAVQRASTTVPALHERSIGAQRSDRRASTTADAQR